MKYLYSQPPDLDLCANDIIFSDFDNVSIWLKSSLEVCWQKMQSDLSRGCNDRLDGLESYEVEPLLKYPYDSQNLVSTLLCGMQT